MRSLELALQPDESRLTIARFLEDVVERHGDRVALCAGGRSLTFAALGCESRSLARGLVAWARDHGWARIVALANADLDCFYGTCGGGGKAFWEKAGFEVVGTLRPDKSFWGEYWTDIIERQRKDKGMTAEEVWTWYRMAYEL